jgi:TonB family protein
MSRRWLIAASGVAHLAVGVGLFVTGVWRLDRLHADPLHQELVLGPQPPAPSGGPVAPHVDKINPKEKKHVPKDPVQPVPRPVDPKPEPTGTEPPGTGKGSGDTPDIGTCTENCSDAKAAAPVCGDGSVDANEQCDDGNTADGDGCSSTCRTELKQAPRPPTTATITPTVLQCLRVSGETQLHPSQTTQSRMLRDDVRQVSGSLRVCLATDGSVASVTLARSTKYDDYDAKLLAGVRTWRYRPYLLEGTPVPACSYVTFNYSIK